MKRFAKWFFGALGVVLLILLLGVGAVYWGWMPVPDWVVTSAVASRNLAPADTNRLVRVINLYQIVKSGPESRFVDQAQTLLDRNATGSDWFRLAKRAWPQVSTYTKNKLREHLQIEPADFAAVDALLTQRLAAANEPDTFVLTPADEKLLKDLDAKYQVTAWLTRVFDTRPSP